MPIELRIQSGARSGHNESFDKPVVTIGRHPMSDLRFDPKVDLDVSTRHGEIRVVDGRYAIHDANSTNGTFVNGTRVPPGSIQPLHDNDVIAFGEHGPKVAVRIAGRPQTPIGLKATTEMETPPVGIAAQFAETLPPGGSGARYAEPMPARRPTSLRVAEAVREQTRGLRMAVIGAVVVLGGVATLIYVKSARESAARDAQIASLIAANAQLTTEFKQRLKGDTLLANNLQRHIDSLNQAMRSARTAQQAAVAQQALQKSHDLQQKFARAGFPAIRDGNDAAVVLILTKIGDHGEEATGFSVSPSGLIVTNRHVVLAGGKRATTIGVKFANTRNWRTAHIVKVADDPAIDLALLQVDGGGTFPAVHDVGPTVDTHVGEAIATIGFPDGSDLPMDGSGANAAATTTMTMGTVSKSIADLLQIDSFASHGSSGSPVFDAHGHVVGVVWGGPSDAAGRIVFAVPAEHVVQLIKAAK